MKIILMISKAKTIFLYLKNEKQNLFFNKLFTLISTSFIIISYCTNIRH